MMDFARFVTRKSVGLSRNSLRNFSIDELKPTAVTLKTQFRHRLDHAKSAALHGGGKKRVEAQHSKGKLTARERLNLLLDEGSFQEYDQLKTHRCTDFGMEKETHYGDGVVTGHGLIHGRKVSIILILLLTFITFLNFFCSFCFNFRKPNMIICISVGLCFQSRFYRLRWFLE